MTTPASTPPPIDERFESLLISPELAIKMLGKRGPGEVSFEQSEQGDARRQLLHVEKVAIENKRLKAQSDASYTETVNHYLHEVLLGELTEQLSFTSDVFNNTLNLSDDTGALLDALSVRAASVSKLEPIAANLPWLYDELMHVVNSPAFRRRDSKGRVIVVETFRTALSFLGIENLRLLIPSLVIKRAMPQVTDPYPCIKLKLTQFAHGTAVSARHLAPHYKLNPVQAYTFGMLSQLGRCAIIRLYFKLFDKVQLHLLTESQKDKERMRHEALLKLAPSASYLIALQDEYADAVSADLIDNMMLKRLFIGDAMRQCATREPCEAGSLPKLLHQARAYSKVRMLHQSRMVEVAEVKPMINEQEYPSGALEKLKSVDIFTLPLSRDEENS
ncbi:HDOD domain-containing protein [Alteromonas lipotrueae]|uniref:HDOD domain-containing protein n=1 Tax=Alteromonas lipotrueae TaxID=2803814 RepID=UPI001C455B9E|nr:HDOD domain-containing protein [Alteromonas lipotrueae]